MTSKRPNDDVNHSQAPPTKRHKSFWFIEKVSDTCMMKKLITGQLYMGQSPFQQVEVIETKDFGRTLVLDGVTQSAHVDEYIYHESMVHPALLAHPNPKTVLIGGGGELASVREALRHKSVEKVIMVDIDELSVKVSREVLKHKGVNEKMLQDPRLEIVIGDVTKFLEKSDLIFDAVIMDIADPIEAGPGIVCYFTSFYEKIKQRLSKGGVFVTQSHGASLLNYEVFCVLNNSLQTVWPAVLPYRADVPSFGEVWGWNICMETKPEWWENAEAIDKLLAERIDNADELLEFYDGQSHIGLFHMPKYFRKLLEKETRVMTEETPVFMGDWAKGSLEQ